MAVSFLKMNGTGNDFIVVDNRRNLISEQQLSEFATRFCPRRTAVGADGVLLVETSDDENFDFRMRYLNADGSEADMCGNGARCIAVFVHKIGVAGRTMRFMTGAGPVGASITEDGAIIDMPEPTQPQLRELVLDGQKLSVYFLSTGVPHVCVFVDDLEEMDVVARGAAIRFHPDFEPAGANANFIAQTGQGLAVRTYERGVEDETLACGTGAAACALSAAVKSGLSSPVPVQVCGGQLQIHFNNDASGFSSIRLEGPVVTAYSGELSWP
jgi:diaminopimelate epimerase